VALPAHAMYPINMENGNGHSRPPVELLDDRIPFAIESHPFVRRKRKRPFVLAFVLFILTVISTLAVGREFSISYAQNRAPFAGLDNPFTPTVQALLHPRLLLTGIPFSLTLISILLVHELGHFFACRYYGIDSSYPYFIPAPSLFGTYGAFIRIRSPILNRKALFDVGISGPVAGFVLALPILAASVYASKIVPDAQAGSLVVFGNPPLLRFFLTLFHPGVRSDHILLSPFARAAWIGLFATAINLLPIGQLDGGHIVYGVTTNLHRRISIGAGVALLLMGFLFWYGWLFFAVLILFLGFRHPPLLDSWTPLDRTRRIWAVVALIIFFLCFTPMPFRIPHP
jgi:membrane-associated protease RseP (regulator of RpoE activity)